MYVDTRKRGVSMGQRFEEEEAAETWRNIVGSTSRLHPLNYYVRKSTNE